MSQIRLRHFYIRKKPEGVLYFLILVLPEDQLRKASTLALHGESWDTIKTRNKTLVKEGGGPGGCARPRKSGPIFSSIHSICIYVIYNHIQF